MKKLAFVALFSGALGVAGCGGDSGGSSGSDSPESYAFVSPTVNSQQVYGATIVDNSQNTISETYSNTVTAVNADGSYSLYEASPGGGSDVVNGTDYSVPTATIYLNSSGQETSAVYAQAGGSTSTCTDTPHGAGPDFPVTIGEDWTLTYTETCPSAAPVTYSQTGNVADVESVTVPAGTFMALKIESTITWTDSAGRTHQESVTRWRDVATMTLIKSMAAYTYSGPEPAHGYPSSEEDVLESQN